MKPQNIIPEVQEEEGKEEASIEGTMNTGEDMITKIRFLTIEEAGDTTKIASRMTTEEVEVVITMKTRDIKEEGREVVIEVGYKMM